MSTPADPEMAKFERRLGVGCLGLFLAFCAAVYLFGYCSYQTPAERAASDRAMREAQYNREQDRRREEFHDAMRRAAEEGQFEQNRRRRDR